MRKRRFSIYPTFIFVFVQLAWLGLLALWIYWYISNYIILTQVEAVISVQFEASSTNIAILVGGVVLLVAISVGSFVIFGNLSHQIKLTRMYDSFIANVTHELKSPLASIQLHLETLQSRETPSSQRQEFVELMMKDASRLGNLINSILEVAGLEEKRALYNMHPYEAESLVRLLFQEAAEQYRLPEGSIEIDGAAPCQCLADRDAIKVVVNNLVDNAVKYSVEAVYIRVALSCTPKRLIVEVTDSGIGIPSGHLKDVFKKFRRISQTNSPNVKGTGLGLYWVREIISHHQGRVTADSDGEGTGATFRFELPVVRRHDRP